jgi:hypothetical protein
LAAVAGGALVLIVGTILLIVFCRKKTFTEDGLVEQDDIQEGTETSWGATLELDADLINHQYDNPLADTYVGADDAIDGADGE